MAASTSTAAHSNNNSCYNVFISHRGPDVKKTFASHMYHRLIAYGLRVFLDYQVLQEGEEFPCQIESAIRTASVQIAIFSPTYADSQWCLDELVLMLETRAHIIPVFYHVKPTELRRTQGEGVYATSLRNLEKKRKCGSEPRHDSKTIENWRNALSRVADISGFDLDEGFNGDEGKLLDQLVKAVLEKGIKKLSVARYPTGLKEKVEDFETKLSLQGFVGITGLGGVGKTTLAKELFNKKSSRYSKSCFLSDVRERAKSSIPSLQGKLLKELTASGEPIDSKDEGLEILRKHFSVLSAPVLLVLDDVDHQDQVHALLPVTDKGILPLPPSSLILITARDKNVLTRSGVQEPSIYNLTGLNTERSTELFCSHAFSQPHPMPGFEDLVNQYIKACNGLPLSLKVFGGLLYGNTNKSYWKNELEELRKALPDEIRKSLQISYDALPREEQQIFLDIACFFIGESRDTAFRVWDASGWNGSRGFENLLSKCLVELDTIVENPFDIYRIRMHDHLRDMGRYLANNTPGFPCRLWRGTKHSEDLLQQSSEATKVRGIRMLSCDNDERADSDSDVDNERASFSRYKMKNLQLLDTDMEEDHLKCLLDGMDPPNLLWFRWRNCPCSSLPPYIPMKKLWVLEVGGNELETLWQEDLQTPFRLRELRELRIRVHVLHKIPKSIGQLKHLELMVLDIWAGDTLELPKEFFDLRSLKHLVLRIQQLTSLPDSFGDLSSLQHIDLSNCYALERLPDSFGDLSSLQHINLSYCCALQRLPNSFGHLSSLQHIDLSYCRALQRLPDSFGDLSSLQHIDLSYCRALERLPDSFGNLSKLKHLDLDHCCMLTLSRGTFGKISTLEYINLFSCDKIEVLPSQIAHQRSLEILYLGLPNLKERSTAIGELNSLEKLVIKIPGLESLPPSLGSDLGNLKYLELRSCRSLKCLPDSFLMLNQLIELTVSDCVKLKRIPDLALLTELRRLDVSFCYELEELPGVEHLRSLEWLEACSCVKLKRIRVSEQLTQLRELDVSFCHELEELPGVEHLRSLQRLKACSCVKLKRIPGLALLTELRELDVSLCYELEELPGVEHLRSLESLKACNCVKLKRIRGSEQLTQLRELDVSFCYELEELQGIEHLRSLKWLKVCNCVKLKTIQGSAQLTELRELNVSFCCELEELPSVDHLKSLKKLQARGCKKLKSIRGSGQHTQLLKLKLFDCSELEELPVLEHLTSLEVLQACNCVKLKRIQGLGQLTKVRKLDVSDCYELEQLSGVEHLRSLNKLRAHSCVKLKRIRVSAQLTQLRELDVSLCYGLEELSGVGHLKSLAVLRASGCVNLKSIPGLAQLTQLQELHVSFCYWLEELLDVGHLKSLKVLRASGFLNLTSIRGLEQLTQLQELDVSGCFELEEVPGVENLKSLQVLRASVCVKLKSIQGLERLALLRELEVSHCDELEELLGVQYLKSLEKLQAFGCRKLKSIRGLELLTELRELDVSGCYELEELPSLEQSWSLEVLKACNCVKLKSIQGLALLSQLRKLYVSGCCELEELPNMRYLMSLDTLKACNCVKLKSIQGSPRLRELDVSGCSELEEMDVEGLQSLAVLRASKCVSLKCLRGLSRLTNLTTLDVTGIPTKVCALDTL